MVRDGGLVVRPHLGHTINLKYGTWCFLVKSSAFKGKIKEIWSVSLLSTAKCDQVECTCNIAFNMFKCCSNISATSRHLHDMTEILLTVTLKLNSIQIWWLHKHNRHPILLCLSNQIAVDSHDYGKDRTFYLCCQLAHPVPIHVTRAVLYIVMSLRQLI